MQVGFISGQSNFFGSIGNKEIIQYKLINKSNLQVNIINYGATITNIFVPDKDGILEDIVLGFDNLEGYLQKGNRYFGSTIGRYANRISNAEFFIDGVRYKLTPNYEKHSLHGGLAGFDKAIWSQIVSEKPNCLGLQYISKNGEEGFPGELMIQVFYTLHDDNKFEIEYKAITNKSTIINLTNHSYFNLSAKADATILDHKLSINSHAFTEINEKLIPTGRILTVDNGPLDFRESKYIGKDISALIFGYDHNFVIDTVPGEVAPAAILYHPGSGRQMELYTNQPGLQFYSGNFLNGTLTGKNNFKYQKHAGLCLETQHFPDSPNQPDFPSTILHPGGIYNYTTTYCFSVKD